MQPKDLIGKKITSISPLDKFELAATGWRPGYKIVLEDGTRIFAMRDEEGNDCGAFHFQNLLGDSFQL